MSAVEHRKSDASHPFPPKNGMERDGFKERDLAILAACRAPAGLDHLASNTGIPRSSVHRRVAKLQKQGLLSRQGNAYGVTDAGQKTLVGSDHVGDASAAISQIWAFLPIFPTQVHRAMAELVLFAWIARRDNLTDDRHPGFILIGPTQRLKSWLIKALCFLMGSLPDRCRVPMMQIRGRGLLARLNSKGKKIYECKALAEPLLWGEELSLADPVVKRDIETLLHGPKDVPVENETVRVDAVPVFELNPKKKQGTLEERVGLDVSRIRRAIVCDFTGVKVTSKDKSESQDRLNRIQKFSPASLPRAQKIIAPECQKLVDEAFAWYIRPECLDYVDPGRILNLVAGASALLPADEATRRVLWDFFTIAETTDFVVPDWRQRMANLTLPEVEKKTIGTDEPKEVSPTPVHNSSEINPFDLDQSILRLKAVVEEAGYYLPDDEKKLEGLLSVSRWLEKEKIEPEDFASVASQMGRYLDLKSAIEELGVTEDRIKALEKLGRYLEEKDLPLDQVLGFVEYHLKLGEWGFTWNSAKTMARVFAEARKGSRSQKRAAHELLALAERGVLIQDEIQKLIEKHRGLEEKKQDLQERVSVVHENLQRYQRAYDRLRASWQNLSAEVDEKREMLKRLNALATNVEAKVRKGMSELKSQLELHRRALIRDAENSVPAKPAEKNGGTFPPTVAQGTDAISGGSP